MKVQKVPNACHSLKVTIIPISHFPAHLPVFTHYSFSAQGHPELPVNNDAPVTVAPGLSYEACLKQYAYEIRQFPKSWNKFWKMNVIIFIEVELICNVILVSSVQQRHRCLFQILFPFVLLHSIEYSSLCYIVGPNRLSILNITVSTCQFPALNLSFPTTLPPLITINSLS